MFYFFEDLERLYNSYDLIYESYCSGRRCMERNKNENLLLNWYIQDLDRIFVQADLEKAAFYLTQCFSWIIPASCFENTGLCATFIENFSIVKKCVAKFNILCIINKVKGFVA